MKVITTPGRLAVAMPLLLGLATIAAAPTVEAAVEQVDIIDGCIDVTEGTVCNSSDDAFNVLLSCNDAALTQVDIIDGKVDVNEGGAILPSDDLQNCDMSCLVGGVRTTEQVDIINGFVDVTEGGLIQTSDDATDCKLIDL